MEKDELNIYCKKGDGDERVPTRVLFTDDIKQFIEYNGKLWIIGKDGLYDENGKKLWTGEIQMACSAEGRESLLLVLDKSGVIYSMSTGHTCRLGRIDNTPHNQLLSIKTTFKNGNVPESNEKFVFITCTNDQCAALTATGELYLWGTNEQDGFGLRDCYGHNYNDLYAPHLRPALDDRNNKLFVHKVGLWRNTHSQFVLLLASSKQQGPKSLYARVKYYSTVPSTHFTQFMNPDGMTVEDFRLTSAQLAIIYAGGQHYQVIHPSSVADLKSSRVNTSLLSTCTPSEGTIRAVDTAINQLYLVKTRGQSEYLLPTTSSEERNSINLQIFRSVQPKEIQHIYVCHNFTGIIIVLPRRCKITLMQTYLLYDAFADH